MEKHRGGNFYFFSLTLLVLCLISTFTVVVVSTHHHMANEFYTQTLCVEGEKDGKYGEGVNGVEIKYT